MSEGLKMNGKEEKYFSFSCMPTTQRRRRWSTKDLKVCRTHLHTHKKDWITLKVFE
jgi:hypothetical protein